jgi:formate-dependent nitrite reductase membrane component NrfD
VFSREDAVEPIIIWQHKWSGDLFIPAYLFLGGLTAGMFIVAAVADLAGLRSRRAALLSRVVALAALPCLALAGFFLTVHLGKPERGLGFPLFFTNYNSWMTRGGWIVGAGAPLVVAYAALWYFRVVPALRRVLAFVGIPVLAGLATYTGLLLAGAGYVPLWPRAFLPRLFLTSGMTTGVAASGLAFLLAWPFVRPAGLGARPTLRVLALVLVALIGLELHELKQYVAYLEAGAPDKAEALTLPTGQFVAATGSRQAFEYLTGGADYPARLLRGPVAPETVEAAVRPRPTLARWFWLGLIGVGLTLPLGLTVLELLADTVSAVLASALAAVKFAAVLTGGFLLRVIMVWGGDLKAPLPFPPSSWPIPGLG